MKNTTLRKWIFAWTYAKINSRLNSSYTSRKQTLLHHMHGTVVEIGPGTGDNLQYYPQNITWIGIEPNQSMHKYLRAEIDARKITAIIATADAEKLPISDHSVDAVVSTLVLCSVHDQTKVLQEVYRILRNNGTFVFIEHVIAPQSAILQMLQSLLQPLWSFVFDGCEPNRGTTSAIERAGFSSVNITRFTRMGALLAAPHIMGVAIK